jgi:hypothetical protein
MEAWLEAHALKAVPRPAPAPPVTEVAASEPAPAPGSDLGARRTRNAEWLRRQLRDIAATLGARDLDRLLTFAEFVKARRVARSYSQRQESGLEEGEGSSLPPSAPPSSPVPGEVHESAQKTLIS